MERRALLMSIGLAMLAMYMVYQYVSEKDKELTDKYGIKFPVVVATRDVLQYETIRPTDIDVIQVPQDMLPPGMLSDPKDVIDSVAAIPISKGEHILDNKIISKNLYSGLDTQIAVGKRAVSIPVNVKSAVGYLLRPGNRIDLAAHFDYRTVEAKISETKVFMQDLLILASGRTIQTDTPLGVDRGLLRGIMSEFKNVTDPREAQEALNHAKTDNNYQTVTIEVTPQQAQIVAYVVEVYPDSLSVMLRHTDDRQLARLATTNLAGVMGPDSYMNRGRKVAPMKALPHAKFYDIRGGDFVPVYQQ